MLHELEGNTVNGEGREQTFFCERNLPFFFSTPNHERFQTASPSLSPPPNWPNLPPCLRRRTKAQSFFDPGVRNFRASRSKKPSSASGKRERRSPEAAGGGGGNAPPSQLGELESQETSRSLLGCEKADLAATRPEAVAPSSGGHAAARQQIRPPPPPEGERSKLL
jgi:hypothetical protein